MRKHMRIRLLSTAIVACLASTVALGQIPGTGAPGGQRGEGQFGMRMGRMGGAQLLMRPDVQRELGLSSEQISQIQTVLQAHGQTPRGTPRTQGQDDGGVMRESAQKVDAEIRKILSESQYKRYQELSVQFAGPRALLRPEVAEKVGLSEEQLTKIRNIQQGEREAMRAIFEEAQGDREALREQMAAMRAETDKKILAVLTEQQRQVWQSLLGKEFKFENIGR